MTLTIDLSPDRATMAGKAARHIAAIADRAVQVKGRAALALSGGTTPAPTYAMLQGLPVAWAKLDLSLADDRWVDGDDPLSNEGAVRRALLDDIGGAARFWSLKTADAHPGDGLGALEQRLGDFPRPIDLVILGLGNDGHTASLFPGSDGIEVAADLGNPARVAAIKVTDPAVPSPARITMTAREICAAGEILVLVHGADKRATLDRVLAAQDWRQAPAKLIFDHAQGPITVYWAP